MDLTVCQATMERMVVLVEVNNLFIYNLYKAAMMYNPGQGGIGGKNPGSLSCPYASSAPFNAGGNGAVRNFVTWKVFKYC